MNKEEFSMARGRKKIVDKANISVRLSHVAIDNLEELVKYFSEDVRQNTSIQLDINRSSIIEHLINTELERLQFASQYNGVYPPSILHKLDRNYPLLVDSNDSITPVENVSEKDEQTPSDSVSATDTSE